MPAGHPTNAARHKLTWCEVKHWHYTGKPAYGPLSRATVWSDTVTLSALSGSEWGLAVSLHEALSPCTLCWPLTQKALQKGASGPSTYTMGKAVLCRQCVFQLIVVLCLTAYLCYRHSDNWPRHMARKENTSSGEAPLCAVALYRAGDCSRGRLMIGCCDERVQRHTGLMVWYVGENTTFSG